ncbi:MASE1 domain-containing protein [Frateuria defendens]|uniref:MASE1 domain-containing protein n=1 Tax=Frateuria defendens TaxID=2219559 RepID=UPI00066FD131|nr:MASE1 domain-containing protein [Frateuria defendens]
MRKGWKAHAWLGHLAVAVAYFVGVELFRAASFSHWLIVSGFRVSALLLVPYRYWPAMILGEMVYLVPSSVQCADRCGSTWAAFNLTPPMLFAAPVIYLAREKWHVLPARGGLKMGIFLACAMAVALLTTLYSLSLLSIMTPWPGSSYWPIQYGEVTARWVVGNYLGILVVAPLVLFLFQAVRGNSWGALRRQLGESRLLLESMVMAVPVVLFLVWLGMNLPQARQIVQVAMFLPVVWLALRHGWQGAAIGGTAASFAVMLLMPKRYDVATLQAEVVMAFAITTMLLVGARIGVLDRRAGQESTDVRMALALAQRNVQVGEMQLRMVSQALEQVGETVHIVCTLMMRRLRHLQPFIDDRSYHRQALVAEDQIYRLADGLYPARWRERGLSGALREGGMARALDEAGIAYWCDTRGTPGLLSSTLQLTLYRLACEAVVDACGRKSASEFRLTLRCGELAGRRGAVLRIESHAHPARLARIQWSELLPHLVRASSGQGRQMIEDRAATFQGRVRERVLPDNGRRLSIILFDPGHSSDG